MKIKSKLVSMVLTPMIICSLVIGFLSVFLAERYLNTEQETILKVALEGFDGDVNAYQDQDVDVTVFEGDTRVESSISGVLGTKASPKVIEEVLNNRNTYFDTDVDVDGTAYYGYYEPTKEGMLFAGKPQKVVNDSMSKMVGYIALVGLVFTAIFGVLGFFIARYMANKITNASINIKSVADGNLSLGDSTIIISNSKDEINEINKSTKHMVQELSAIIREGSEISEDVSKSSEELSTTSETTLSAMNEVSKAVEEIAVGLQSQTEAVQAMFENIGGIHEDIESIRVSSNDISDCSNRLDKSSNTMKQKLTETLESNQKVNISISDISKKIQSMNEVIDNVKGIVSVIGDISSQTKLLSLNASIEAARAGEFGRGFSVVAHSISDLSEDTSSQVEEITKIIKTLVKDFGECIKVIEEVVSDGNIQKEDINSVIVEFESLSGEIKVTSEKVQSIGVSIEKVVSEAGQVTNEIEGLVDISQTSAAATQEVNASVEEINALMNGVSNCANELSCKSEKLSNSFDFFKL